MEQFLDRHSLSLREYDFLYPLIKKWKTGEIVGCLASTLAGTVFFGDKPLAGIGTAAATRLMEGLVFLGIDKLRLISNPLYQKFGFHPDDFVLLQGYRKNYKRELVTAKFEEIVRVPEAKPEFVAPDKILADLLTGALGKFEGQKVIYGEEYFEPHKDQFVEGMLKKDILCVGGPISNDPLRDVMEQMARLPCNYKLKNLTKDDFHNPEETGSQDITLPKYPIMIKGKEEPLSPKWNMLDWGMITCVDKQVIFEESVWGEVKGLFFNVSGCHWFGTHASGKQLLKPKGVTALGDYVEGKISTRKNFQVVFEVKISPETKSIISFDFFDAFKVKA